MTSRMMLFADSASANRTSNHFQKLDAAFINLHYKKTTILWSMSKFMCCYFTKHTFFFNWIRHEPLLIIHHKVPCASGCSKMRISKQLHVKHLKDFKYAWIKNSATAGQTLRQTVWETDRQVDRQGKKYAACSIETGAKKCCILMFRQEQWRHWSVKCPSAWNYEWKTWAPAQWVQVTNQINLNLSPANIFQMSIHSIFINRM